VERDHLPALALRARREIMPGFRFILPAAEAERLATAVPSARVTEMDANHYAITTHDDPIAAIGAFLRTSWRPGARPPRRPPDRRAFAVRPARWLAGTSRQTQNPLPSRFAITCHHVLP
jgi:hypothetical protein